MKASRIRTLIGKEWIDLARNHLVLVPVAMVTLLTVALPFLLAVLLPAMTGHPLSDDSDLVNVSRIAGAHDGLSGEARIQLFLFQQFLTMFLLIPITGAMSLAAHAIVGEKQARTLEPLLATPITTLELLVAKVLGTLAPTLGIALAGLGVYLAGVVIVAEPGVLRAMASVRTAVLLGVVGPSTALVALQSAIVISSRVNDPRTAQQFGVLIIVPVSFVVVGQFMGRIWLSTTALALVGLGAFGVWILLMLVSVVIFDREAILTRWR